MKFCCCPNTLSFWHWYVTIYMKYCNRDSLLEILLEAHCVFMTWYLVELKSPDQLLLHGPSFPSLLTQLGFRYGQSHPKKDLVWPASALNCDPSSRVDIGYLPVTEGKGQTSLWTRSNSLLYTLDRSVMTNIGEWDLKELQPYSALWWLPFCYFLLWL